MSASGRLEGRGARLDLGAGLIERRRCAMRTQSADASNLTTNTLTQ
ncbi:MAG TPA: hypothetical protein VIJ96_01850 [Acidothermaceae bacterium]